MSPLVVGCWFSEFSLWKIKYLRPQELFLIKLPSFPSGVICKLCCFLFYVKWALLHWQRCETQPCRGAGGLAGCGRGNPCHVCAVIPCRMNSSRVEGGAAGLGWLDWRLDAVTLSPSVRGTSTEPLLTHVTIYYLPETWNALKPRSGSIICWMVILTRTSEVIYRMYVCVLYISCIYTHTDTHIYTHIHITFYMYTRIHIYTYICINTHTHIGTYTHNVYTCIDTRIHAHNIHIYTCIHTHEHWDIIDKPIKSWKYRKLEMILTHLTYRTFCLSLAYFLLPQNSDLGHSWAKSGGSKITWQ